MRTQPEWPIAMKKQGGREKSEPIDGPRECTSGLHYTEDCLGQLGTDTTNKRLPRLQIWGRAMVSLSRFAH
jgi:hypothetical protein